MHRISDMADDLATEVLTEAAETFFGQRKALEDDLELFVVRSRQVLELAERVDRARRVLHGVLMDSRMIDAFYGVLGLPSPEQPDAASPEEIIRFVSKSRAWTMAGRYFKLLFSAYSRVHAAGDAYLHGGYKDDPAQPKRKIAFIGYLKLAEWAEKLNKTIAKLNTEQAPSEVLQFMKGLDVQFCAKENTAGGSCEIGRDRGMLFTYIDFASLCLPVFPEYPLPDFVRQDIWKFAGEACVRRDRDVRMLLRELGRGRRG